MFIGFYLVPMEFESHMKQYFKNIVLNMRNCSLEFINENILIIYARQRVYKKKIIQPGKGSLTFKAYIFLRLSL